MNWARTETEAAIERSLIAEAPLARRSPSKQLRARTLRALEHAARTSSRSSTFVWPHPRDRRRGLAMILGMVAVSTLAIVATMQVTPTSSTASGGATQVASTPTAPRTSPQSLADALPESTTLLVASVSSRLTVADDALHEEAQALRHDLSRAFAHLRQSAGLGSSAQQ